jgi:hypothetical protein
MNRAYVGFIDRGWERRVLVLPLEAGVGYPLPLRLDLQNHSPTGFAWGYGGSGPAQLALAILADHLGDDARAARLHQRFKWRAIGPLNGDAGFVLTGKEVAAHVAALDEAPPDEAA